MAGAPSQPRPGVRRWNVRHIGRAAARDLLQVRPAVGAERTAIRAGSVMLVALLVLLAAGRLDLAGYAVFGVFASVYGGGVPTPRRWRMQASGGAVIIAGVVLGASVGSFPDRRWLAVPVVAVWAGVAASLSDRFGWRPPGPLFPVLAAATSSAIPVHPSAIPIAVGVTLLTVAVSIALAALEALVLPLRIRTPVPLPAPRPDPRRRHVQWIRCVVAVLVAGGIATTVGVGHPYWAMVSVVVPLAVPGLRTQLARGLHRTVGTAIGLVLAGALLILPLPVLVAVVVLAALQAGAELLMVRNQASALVLITPLALLAGRLAVPQPVGSLLLDRLVETAIGVGVGVLVAIVTRERPAIR